MTNKSIKSSAASNKQNDEPNSSFFNKQKYEEAAESLKKYISSSPGKSSETDQAFALLDEVNTSIAVKGERDFDAEVRELAASLEKKSINDRSS